MQKTSFFRKYTGGFVIGLLSSIVVFSIFIIVINMFAPEPTVNVGGLESSTTLKVAKIKEEILFDDEMLKVIANSIYPSDYGTDYIIELTIENKIDKDLYIYSDLAALNHCMFSPIIEDHLLSANSVIVKNIRINSEDFDKYQIENIGLIEFSLTVHEEERSFGYLPPVVKEINDLIIKTNLYDEISETYIAEEGKLISDSNGISIILLNPKDAFTENSPKLLVINKSNKSSTILFNNFMINSKETPDQSASIYITMYPNSIYFDYEGMYFDTAVDATQPISSDLYIFEGINSSFEKLTLLNKLDISWNEVE